LKHKTDVHHCILHALKEISILIYRAIQTSEALQSPFSLDLQLGNKKKKFKGHTYTALTNFCH